MSKFSVDVLFYIFQINQPCYAFIALTLLQGNVKNDKYVVYLKCKQACNVR